MNAPGFLKILFSGAFFCLCAVPAHAQAIEPLPVDTPVVILTFPIAGTEGHAYCRATKIGPRQLLTAGHCVLKKVSGTDWWFRDKKVSITAAGGMQRNAEIAAFHLNPILTQQLQSYGSRLWSLRSGIVEIRVIDIALIEIANPDALSDIPQAYINFEPPAPNDAIKTVGYFCSKAHEFDVRYFFTPNLLHDKISTLNRDQFFVDNFALCRGDSGGPAFASNHHGYNLIGVLDAAGGEYDGRNFTPQTRFLRLDTEPIKAWLQGILNQEAGA